MHLSTVLWIAVLTPKKRIEFSLQTTDNQTGIGTYLEGKEVNQNPKDVNRQSDEDGAMYMYIDEGCDTHAKHGIELLEERQLVAKPRTSVNSHVRLHVLDRSTARICLSLKDLLDSST